MLGDGARPVSTKKNPQKIPTIPKKIRTFANAIKKRYQQRNVISHTTYIRRCFQLAQKGKSFVKPNPMVGAVIVHNNTIIGEGYHRKIGEAHAEANAIGAVRDEALLSESTLYVSLEPCSHHGKTPPCADLIVAKKIPRVVVAATDPNPKVSGKGIQIMREHGIDVTVGVLENEARELNKMFFFNQIHRRPYIILKWAQSSDGFIDKERSLLQEQAPACLSNDITAVLSHKLRTEVQAILVGTRTALLDNPQLTARKWFGENPVRVVIDRENKLPSSLAIFDNSAPTIVFTAVQPENLPKNNSITYISINVEQNFVEQIAQHLFHRGIYSLLVEGGTKTLSSFIENGLWNEAFVEISDDLFFSGIKAPDIQAKTKKITPILNANQIRLESEITRNFT